MDDRLKALYSVPDSADYADTCLQSLQESCLVLETQLREMTEELPEHNRHIIEAYLDIRDELEFETIKMALRWGKRNYK